MEVDEARAIQMECCIHCEDFTGPVKAFSEDALRKCIKVMKARKQHNLNLSNYMIPSATGTNLGYHPKCYAKFTAIKSKYLLELPEIEEVQDGGSIVVEQSRSAESGRKTREKGVRKQPQASSSGVLKPVCIFCKNVKIMHKNNRQILILTQTKNFEKKVIDSAQKQNDFDMLGMLTGGDFVSKEVRYHKICAMRYVYKGNKAAKSESSDWHLIRKSHEEAFAYLSDYIFKHIVENEEVLTLKALYSVYTRALETARGGKAISPKELKKYRALRLRIKILTHKRFAGVIEVCKFEKDPSQYFYKNTVTFAARDKKISEMKNNNKLREAAYIIRSKILGIEKKPSLDKVNVEAVTEGECEIPDFLTDFFKDIMCGASQPKAKEKEPINRRCNAMAQDVIFNTTRGRIKPEKHLTLGVTMKTITGSKKAIEILNRFGHSCSYSTTEEIETEMAYTSCNESCLLPSFIRKEPNLNTGVAFNNFDRFVETPSGKNTLHDTVGIIYQNERPVGQWDEVAAMQEENIVPEDNPISVEIDEVDVEEKIRRRRSFDEIIHDVEPYKKTPKSNFTISAVSSHNPLPCSELRVHQNRDYRLFDMMQALYFVYEVENVPGWVGFNATIFKDHLPQQQIGYLPQINASPTSYSVVAHTMKAALQIAKECKQDSIMCTYDLNIARMAIQIQKEESPSPYDKILIFPGTFHIEMAFFKALGKIINESGICEVLEDADVLASGSVLGFIGGTNYNRCKSIHTAFALALRMKHYKKFAAGSLWKEREVPGNDFADEWEIKKCLKEEREKKYNHGDAFVFENKLEEILSDYKAYEEKTIAGENGKTAQYYMQYVHYMDLYHDFVRSVKMGDLDLFKKSLAVITDLFFCLNHVNYSRWNVAFIDNLDNAVKKENQVGRQLNSGIISIRRTPKHFSRSPVDLVLEQTINADAGNKLTGISALTNSISARQRWAKSHSQRTAIVSHTLNKAGLTKKEDVTADLKPYGIKKVHKIVDAILKSMDGYIDPFDDEHQQSLANICTGKSVTDSTAIFLTNILSKGREQHDRFRQECAKDPSRFYKPIKNNVLQTFASEGVKMKIKKNEKVKEVKMERNLFARLLTLSTTNKIDLKLVLSYPLTPVPLSLGHCDGSMAKTNKSALFNYLEKKVSDMNLPQKVDIFILDGFYFFHLLENDLPLKFGGVALLILKKVKKLGCKTVYLVFDEYVTPSIKDQERSRRAGGVPQDQYTIKGYSQNRPKDFLKALRNDMFKEALVSFLLEEWKREEYADILDGLSFYANKGEDFWHFTSIEGKVRCGKVPSLRNNHWEADCKIIYILTTISAANVVIKSSDTDVLIATIGNLHHVNANVEVIIETGTMKYNSLRQINVRKISKELGEEVSKGLPAFHALTGCDYTSCFYKLGKIKPFKDIESNSKFQEVLAKFGEKESLTEKEYSDVEEIVIKFYSKNKYQCIDDLRFDMFLGAFSKTKKSEVIPKGIEGSSLPPCKNVLRQKILRAKFVTVMWTGLNKNVRSLMSPTDFGWKNEGGSYAPEWYKGPPLPANLEEVFINEEERNAEDDEIDEVTDDEIDFESDED